jgi:hypothetical protein
VRKTKARVPWAKLRDARDDFIDPEYLPEDVQISQFHHIRLDEANTILEHWTTRKAAGAIPFRFKDEVEKAAHRRKQAPVPTEEAQAQEDRNSQGGGAGGLDHGDAQESTSGSSGGGELSAQAQEGATGIVGDSSVVSGSQ